MTYSFPISKSNAVHSNWRHFWGQFMLLYPWKKKHFRSYNPADKTCLNIYFSRLFASPQCLVPSPSQFLFLPPKKITTLRLVESFIKMHFKKSADLDSSAAGRDMSWRAKTENFLKLHGSAKKTDARPQRKVFLFRLGESTTNTFFPPSDKQRYEARTFHLPKITQHIFFCNPQFHQRLFSK